MALVPASAGPPPASSDALVPWGGSGGTLGDPIERKLERLRADREAHQHKQIWTKDPHGGPYRKVNANKGYDPLFQLPDGTQRKADLGYERVKLGPTSNFVGNHMTQGAIDLVQAQLEAPSAPPELLLGAAAAAAGARRPLLLAGGAGAGAAPAAPAQQRPLQQYSWADGGGAVALEVPLAQLGWSTRGSGGGSALVTCTIQADRVELVIAEEPSDAGSDSGGASGASQACRLLLHPLHAAVVPARSRCYAKGLAALPPCADQSAACGSGSGEQPEPEAAAASPAPAAPAAAAQLQQAIRFRLPPGAEVVVVELCKAAPEQPWEALRAALPLARGGAAAPGGPPDVAALRRTVRQQLGRAPAAPSTPSHPQPPPAAAAPVALDAGSARTACLEALQAAEALIATGQHAEALQALTACAQLLPALEAEAALQPVAARLHALRARCKAQLGSIKQAAASYSAAIRLMQQQQRLAEAQVPAAAPAACVQAEARAALAEVQGELLEGQPELGQLLLTRSAAYEQMEQIELALADAEAAARLQPAPAAALLAAQRLRRACRAREG